MTKKIIPYELGKLLLLAVEAACVAAIGYGAARMLWFGVQWVLAPIPAATMAQASAAIPDKIAFARKIIDFLTADVTRAEALKQILRHAVWFVGGVLVLMVARGVLRNLERRFKQRFLPEVLKERFSDFSYEAKRRRAVEETLCDVGLLSRVERYYTANRLEGLYRDCWVASQEIVCGGVYADHYTSHKVKVRGQWLTVRLNTDFEGTVIIESKGTKNRFTHRSLARKMCELELSYEPFAEQFVCYASSTEDAHSLLTREMADKLLALLDKYPDLCVIFRQGMVHVLIRRRSFNRRLELAVPFCLPYLRREATRLYGPLQDFTDLLLE